MGRFQDTGPNQQIINANRPKKAERLENEIKGLQTALNGQKQPSSDVRGEGYLINDSRFDTDPPAIHFEVPTSS
jgi:hypothetical protein